MAVVLIVEDEDQVRVLAESYLEEQGHQVLSAGTPAGALALLHQLPKPYLRNCATVYRRIFKSIGCGPLTHNSCVWKFLV